jgi:hypothetical protein
MVRTNLDKSKVRINIMYLTLRIGVATLALGSRPRQKGLRGCGPRGSVGECEGLSHHTPKATPTLRDGVPVDSRNFRDRFEGSKLNSLSLSLYHWKALGT